MSEMRVGALLCASTLLCGSLFGQTVSSTLLGTVADPGDAAIPGIEVQVKDQLTGLVRSVATGTEGIFRFNQLPPSTYTLTIKATGFKTYNQQNIALASSDIRDLGRIVLTLGAITEEVSVTAIATPVQTASSEKSSLVDGNQLNQIALRGRDLFGYLKLIPGVTGVNGGETTGTGLPGAINGGGQKNFTVDGITDIDTGSNGTVHYEPNLDSIAEIRVLTANYQAEYGRNASGLISVVTKGGGREFHGSAWETKRHEMFNAKSFFENFNNNPKGIYRYDVFGFSVGGPVVIPKLFNQNRQKLFFFVSQEYTRQRPSSIVSYFNVPTAAERAGDFSKTVDQNGKAIQLLDPTTRNPVPGNNISGLVLDKASAAYGQAMLNFYPLPNRCDLGNNGSGCFTEPDATQLNRRNFRSIFNGKHPRRNDVVRIDFNPTSKMSTWARYINDYDLEETSSNIPMLNAGGEYTPYYEDHPNPGHGWGVGITYTLSPRLVNEFTFGKSYNTWSYYVHDPSLVDRSRLANPPAWNDFSADPLFVNDKDLKRPSLGPGSQNFAAYIPGMSFTGGAAVASNFSTSRPYTNWNDIYSFNNNISYVAGAHSLKAGFYYERTGKVQQAGSGAYLGTYNFGSSSSFPQDANHGYANAYLGNFQTYSEGRRVIGDYWFTGIELFAQDNWRISRRLTLDLGLRLYHLPPQENLNNNSAVMMLSTYDPQRVPRLYYPACKVAATTTACPAASQVARDLATGYTTFPSLVGTFVPFAVGGYSTEPNYFNGMQVADGQNPNLPHSLFSPPMFSPAVRIGLAWDVFGNGKTAIRTGFGQFYNRGDGNQIMGYGGQPPVTFTRTVYYSQIAAVPGYANTAAVSPIGNGGITGHQPYENLMNGSFGVQQNVGFGTVIDASYVFSLRRHLLQTQNLNAVPLFSQYDPANYNPWNGQLAPNASGKALNDNYFRPIQGLGGISRSDFRGSNYYHSLQVAVRRGMAHGLSYGAAYTWAKIMSQGSPANYDLPFFKNWNRGPSFAGAPHILVTNFIYQVPGLGRKFNLRPLGWVTDNWTMSGIYQWQSHSVIGAPGISFTGTSTNNPAPNFTGSAEGARMNVIGNPTISGDQVTFTNTFNWQAFQPPVPCSLERQTMDCFGNAGSGSTFRIPTWMNNWDMTFAKSFRAGERREFTFRAEMYNIFNHTQFSSINSTIQFDLASYQNWIQGKGQLVQSNTQLGRYTGTQSPRRMAMSLRFQF